MPQIQQIDLFLSQIFWLIIAFSLVYLFVSMYFIPRVASVVEHRNSEIRKNIEVADEFLVMHKEMKSEMEEILASAREEGGVIRNMATQKAEDYMQSQIRAFEKELTKKNAKEEERLARLKHQLISDAGISADSLAKEIVKVVFPSNIIVRM